LWRREYRALQFTALTLGERDNLLIYLNDISLSRELSRTTVDKFVEGRQRLQLKDCGD
jgi:hypothetical protein